VNEPSIRAEPTPNPESYKFTLDHLVVEGRSETYSGPEQAFLSPLARALFQVDGVGGIFFLKDFVSVRRKPGASWEVLVPRIAAVLRDYFADHA
jgi:hypothetical protein